MKKIILTLAAIFTACYLAFAYFLKSNGSIKSKFITTNISELYQNPLLNKKEVRIQGIVASSSNIGVISYFELQDNTGVITIISDVAPLADSKVIVNGIYHQYFKIGERQISVIKSTNISNNY
jgi:aspartyl/asparaginyl-tRNA synthetase